MPGIHAVPGRVRRAIVRLRDTTSLDRNHSTRDDRSDEQELTRDKLCFALPFLASLIYPGHGQLIPLLIRLLLGVESPVDRRG